jgi:peptidoglycan/LPS O-acetylase OafA/YrhL
LPGIEGIRGVAAASIVVFHVYNSSAPGGRPVDVGHLTTFFSDLALGVTLFFTLSGFLLYRPFVAALLRFQERPSFRSYLRNRALRIVPAYWGIFLFSAFVLQSVIIRVPDGRTVNGSPHGAGQIISDTLLVQHYRPATVTTGIGPAWSLAVEIVFYLTLPLLAVLAWGLGRRAASRRARRLSAMAPPFLLLVMGLFGKFVAARLLVASGDTGGWGANWHSVLERSFACQADLFAFGMLVAVLRVDAEDGLFSLSARARRRVAAAAILTYVVLAELEPWDKLGHSLENTAAAFASALILLLVVTPPATRQRSALVTVLETRPLIWLGLISYSLFLVHEPVISWLHDRGFTVGGIGGLFVNTAVVGAIAIALSYVSYRFLERPALRLKRRARASAPAAPVANPAG